MTVVLGVNEAEVEGHEMPQLILLSGVTEFTVPCPVPDFVIDNKYSGL